MVVVGNNCFVPTVAAKRSRKGSTRWSPGRAKATVAKQGEAGEQESDKDRDGLSRSAEEPV